MCFDPWDNPISDYAELYLNAAREAINPTRTEEHRHTWLGKVTYFAEGYKAKLEELDSEELANWIDEINELYEPGAAHELLKQPAVAEQQQRADGGTLAGEAA